MRQFYLLIFFCLACKLIPAQTFIDPNFSRTTIGDGWVQALGAVFSKDGQKLFVWEKRGLVFVCNKSGGTYVRQETPVIDITAEVLNWMDHGLLGFTLDPDYLNNGFIYLLYAVDRRFLLNDNSIVADAGFAATIGRVTRYKTVLSGSVLAIDPTSRTILLGESITTGIPLLHESHGLGSLVFADDGTLLLTAGDAASFDGEDIGNHSQTFYAQALAEGIIKAPENVGAFRAQLLNSHNGKLLRIDPMTGNGVESNPFYSAADPRSPRSRVWAFGLRNPFRFIVKPGSGSTNPSTGDIGEILIADVGWEMREDFNIVTEPGQNFGWPVYEGQGLTTRYTPYAAIVQNLEEPNPLAGGAGCTRPYFTFRELIKDPTADGNTTIYNPCNASVEIGTGARYVHRRPSLDYGHNEVSTRVGIFTGNNPDIVEIGTPESGVVGMPFQGFCAIAGMWYTGDDFPATYKNKFFLCDWSSGWIKHLSIDYTDVVTRVDNFAEGFSEILGMVENPVDGRVVIIGGWPHVMLVDYGGNQPPLAKPVASVRYGGSPLAVNFTGNTSVDPGPGGSIVSYSWDFGGGAPSSSNLADPGNVLFTEASGDPRKFVVKLTVTDNQGASHTDSIIISVNNTPPQVSITSPVNNSTYVPGTDSTYALAAIVVDAEHPAAQLKYEWQTFLRHNTHEHAGAVDNNISSSTRLQGIGCNGDTYYWFIRLAVTDAAGLTAVDSAKLFPACNAGPDLTPPTVSSVEPLDGTTQINTGTVIKVIFNEPIDASTVDASSFQLRDASDQVVPATLLVSAGQVTLTPDQVLQEATTYTALLSSGVNGIKDTAGNALASDYSWAFTTGAGSLPILLKKISVTQEGSLNIVKWTTEEESNMDYFELERSTNGLDFQPINRQAATNTPGTHQYSYTDKNVQQGIVYYRLKMVEFGIPVVKYSNIVRTHSEKDQHDLKIVPNPVTVNFYLNYYAAEDEKITLEIKDITGKLLQSTRENVNRGQNIIYVHCPPALHSGVYLLVVKNKNKTRQIKFVKAQ